MKAEPSLASGRAMILVARLGARLALAAAGVV